jgi:hypothetical protein
MGTASECFEIAEMKYSPDRWRHYEDRQEQSGLLMTSILIARCVAVAYLSRFLL